MTPSFVSSRCACLVVCGLLLGLAQNAEARLYRWENSEGKVIYSDQVPPEEAKQKRESLNKAGRVMEVIEGAKTKEQWELEKRLEMLRKEQEKIIAKQKSDDRALLSNYRNESDLRAAIKNKLQALEGQQKVVEGNELRMLQQLKSQQRDAAKYEREGKPVPKTLLGEIAATTEQLVQARADLKRQLQQKEQMIKDFEVDIERYNFLTRSNTEAAKISDSTAALKAADQLGLFACADEAQCAKAWVLTRSFVQKHTSTTVEVANDTLIMSSDPQTDEDMSLSASKIVRPGQKVEIFLDIRCYKTVSGQELCPSTKVREMRMAFRPFIEAGLTAQ